MTQRPSHNHGRDSLPSGGAPAHDGRPQPAQDALLLLTRDGVIRDVQSGPDRLGGHVRSDLKGMCLDAVWSGGLAEAGRAMIRRALRSRQLCSCETDDGQDDRRYELICIPQGKDRVLLLVRDVTARRDAFERTRSLAYTDDATGLPNREYLLEALGKITQRLRMSEGRAAVICFDVEQLDLAGSVSGRDKQVAVLQEIAERFSAELRGVNRIDEVDDDKFSVIARLDFRQFGVVLPSIETGSDAAAVTARLVDAVQQPIEVGATRLTVAVSAGMALYPQDGKDAESLLENALLALDDAKNSHSSRQKFNSGTVRMRALQRLDLTQQLKSALENREFELSYQPLIRAGTREAVGAEALLRWPHGMFEAKAIRRTIAAAEFTGLMVPIGEWVLRESCAQLGHWQASGRSEFRVSVNLSLQEFCWADLAPSIAAFLSRSEVEPAYLDIEISEHMLFRDAAKEFEVCASLKELGVGVMVDDYGIGACSLVHLATSPIDAIKIDRSIVANAVTNAADRSACAAAVAMARELNLRVVAEGVETEEQATLLEKVGCDYLQGYLFCQPLPAGELGDYLTSLEQRRAAG